MVREAGPIESPSDQPGLTTAPPLAMQVSCYASLALTYGRPVNVNSSHVTITAVNSLLVIAQGHHLTALTRPVLLSTWLSLPVSYLSNQLTAASHL